MKDTLSTPIDVISEVVDRRQVARPMSSTKEKESFAETYATTGNLTAACDSAGISMPTGRKWLADPRFVAAVFRRRQMALSGEGASLGYRVLVEIATAQVLDSEGKFVAYAVPVSERRQAAIALLRLGGHNEAVAAAAAAQHSAAALHELSEDQLEQHIASAKATLQQLQAPDAPDVTPDPSPSPSLL